MHFLRLLASSLCPWAGQALEVAGGGGGRGGGGGGCPDAFAGGALDVFVPTLICQKLVVKLN